MSVNILCNQKDILMSGHLVIVLIHLIVKMLLLYSRKPILIKHLMNSIKK